MFVPSHVQLVDHAVPRLPPEHSTDAAEFHPKELMTILPSIEQLLPRSIEKLLALLYDPTQAYAAGRVWAYAGAASKQPHELTHLSCGSTKLQVAEFASYVALM